MTPFTKTATAVGLAAALAMTAATPASARDGRWAAAGAGFLAGTFLGAAIANSNARYYDSYAYAPAYYDSYAYAPGYYDSYAYAPGFYGSIAYSPRYYNHYAYSPAPRYRSYSTVPAYNAYAYAPARRYGFTNNGPHREDHLTGTGIGAAE